LEADEPEIMDENPISVVSIDESLFYSLTELDAIEEEL
jgi:hypothetical protein